MMILSLIVDHEADLHYVLIFIAISVSFAGLIQLLYWNSNVFFKSVNSIIIILLLKKIPHVNHLNILNTVDRTLFLNSWVATSIFSIRRDLSLYLGVHHA
jgi:hypothetical protein